MKIVICQAVTPFMYGGAEKHVDTLFQELKKRGHEVFVVQMPFKWYPPFRLIDSILMWKLADLSESNGEKIDLIISTKFPTYAVDHPNHIAWIFHQHRPVYDLKDTEFDDLKNYSEGEYVRKKVIEFDNIVLKKLKKIFTNSKTVSNRLLKYNNIESEPLFLPIPNSEKFHNKEFGDYVLFPSRISPLKRQDLLIEAMNFTKTNVKCKIIGFESHKKWIEGKIQDQKQREKIELLTNLSDDELIDIYSRCLAVVYIPRDEDYGMVTLEAFYSKKPVLTATDSGGPLEFVKDNINGYVVAPNPKIIAEKLDSLYSDREKTINMGKKGYEMIKKLNLSWDDIIKKLMS